MSDLVERLAARWARAAHSSEQPPVTGADQWDAVWWAIADELELDGGLYQPSNPYKHAVNWLRSSVGEAEPTEAPPR